MGFTSARSLGDTCRVIQDWTQDAPELNGYKTEYDRECGCECNVVKARERHAGPNGAPRGHRTGCRGLLLLTFSSSLCLSDHAVDDLLSLLHTKYSIPSMVLNPGVKTVERALVDPTARPGPLVRGAWRRRPPLKN